MTLEARRAMETRLGRVGMITLGGIVTILAVTGSALLLRFAGEDLHLALRFDSGRGGITLGANHPLEIS